MVDAPKNAVPVGTVAGVQLAAVLKSELPGAVDQVASWARAGMAASNAAAAVVANKCARISPPPAEILNADRLSLATLSVIHARGNDSLSQAAPISCNLWLLPPRMRDQFRPHEVIKYVIAVPAVAAAHESAVDAADGSCTRHLRRMLCTCFA